LLREGEGWRKGETWNTRVNPDRPIDPEAIPWGESAYAEARYICTQVLFAQLFPGAIKSLTSMCDRLVLESSERDDRHGALLDAHMTADALILLKRQLKHGESGAPRSWTST
jgi:DNA polymerase III subunit epsilon